MAWRSALGLTVAAALVITGGCGSAAHHPSPTTSPPTTTAPATSGYSTGAGMQLGVGAQPSSWNCDAAGVDQATCLAVVDQVWPSVYRLSPSGQPQLDTSFVTAAAVTSTSPQTVVYHINPKATWSDGVPITAADFIYAWQAQSGSPAYRDVGGAAYTPASTAGYDDIASVAGSPSDPRTVTVTFAQPDPDWQALFGAGSPLLPAQIAQQVGFDHGFTDPVSDVVSGGPFLVQSASPGRSVTLVRNPRWWGTTAALSSVTVRFTATPAEAASALSDGILTCVTVTGDPGSFVDASSYAAYKKLGGIDVKAVASSTYEDLRLDGASPALADPNLRRAITAAVDRSALLKLVPAASDAGIGPLGDRFTLPGSSAYTDDTPSGDGSGDLDAARRTLQAAGYVATPGAPVTKDGKPVTLRLTAQSGTPVLQAQEQAIAAALDQLGIAVAEADSTDLASTLAGTGWDLALTTVDASPFPGQAAASFAAADPVAAPILAVSASTLDPTKRASLLHQADTTLWADAVDLPLFQLPSVLAYREALGGAAPAVGAEGPTADLATWGITGSS